MSSTFAQACCDGAYGLVLCYLGALSIWYPEGTFGEAH
jgi:hypothetical protein